MGFLELKSANGNFWQGLQRQDGEDWGADIRCRVTTCFVPCLSRRHVVLSVYLCVEYILEKSGMLSESLTMYNG